MYLLIYSSGFHDYYAINSVLAKGALDILEKYNDNAYPEHYTLFDLAKEDGPMMVYELKDGMAFDDDLFGLPTCKFDYLDQFRKHR